ncbi:Redox-sensing transcriptional repressor Rex [bioreactor metagenome]|uniref:Redox-sensing transcriptional repressor Rex n=1 Tax=bioreactor metagenome TaxID=1076179 RepID=A0A645E653_9ZZZZ
MDNKANENISLTTLQRLPNYLRYFKAMAEQGTEYLSSVTIAKDLNLTPMVVKKDLSVALITDGKPKLGYQVAALISDIEQFLGYDNTQDAVIVGVGQLGKALMSYEGFSHYGLNIIVGFDIDEHVRDVNGKKVLPMNKFRNLVERMKIHIGIITVPKENAQEVAELMIRSGIRAIWNWAPVQLNVPEQIAVKQEDLAASLAVLSNRLKELIKKE